MEALTRKKALLASRESFVQGEKLGRKDAESSFKQIYI